jgi:hypothetical protein
MSGFEPREQPPISRVIGGMCAKELDMGLCFEQTLYLQPYPRITKKVSMKEKKTFFDQTGYK